MHDQIDYSRSTEPKEAFETAWPEIAESIGKAFNMDAEEQEELRDKRVARLIAAIPFLAGCEQPARTAVAHVGTYLLSIRNTKPFFNADATDDIHILERLRLIMNFRDGDKKIIDKGMSLLALCMIDDYKRDIYIDETLGKYNPIASGAFDYESTRADLVARIEAVDCPQMDEIFDQDMGGESYWYN
jgi:hypothetical protein